MMRMFTVAAPLRFLFLFAAIVLWIGIWDTGFAVVSWIFYLPAAFFLLAGVTGVCPGLAILNWLMRTTNQDAS